MARKQNKVVMCNGVIQSWAEIDERVKNMIRYREIFTAHSIWHKLKYIPIDMDVNNVVIYVQEMFDSGKMPGYCSTIVRPELGSDGKTLGPVLFFPQPNYIKNRCANIRDLYDMTENLYGFGRKL